MEPAFYLRVLRLRWKIITLFVILGALVGLAFTVLESRDEGEEITYWLAKHKLIVSSTAVEDGRFPNLLQTALSVTGGPVPEAVAEELGRDEAALTSRVRTITDLEVNVIEISAVSEDPADAETIADGFAAELVEFLDARDREAYAAELDGARAELSDIGERLEAIDVRIVELEDELDELRLRPARPGPTADPADAEADPGSAAGVEPDPADAEADPESVPGGEPEGPGAEVLDEEARGAAIDAVSEELRALRIERESRASLYESALADADALERTGAPPPLLETLDKVAPFQIGPKLYSLRLEQGREGRNNFNSRNVDDGSGGGLRLGETVSNPVVRAVLGAVAGLLLGIGAVLLHLRFDPRLRTKVDVEDAFDLPVLAEVPRFGPREMKRLELHAVTRPRSVVTEAYRMIRSALLFARATAEIPLTIERTNGDGPVDDGETDEGPAPAGREIRVVMISSPGPSEGKTTTTANLAVVLAEAGYEVLVVNCDYRLPKLHKFFDRPHVARRTLETGVPGVTLVADVVPPGVTNPTAVVESQRNLIRKARDRYDVVLLDTAPLLATNDALSLLPVVDLLLLVAREGKTDREAAVETIDLLRRRRANLAGVVLTGSSGFGRSRYYYKYRYGGYYDPEGEPRTSADTEEPKRAAHAAGSTS